MVSLGFAKFVLGRSAKTLHEPSIFSAGNKFLIRIATKADLLASGWRPADVARFMSDHYMTVESEHARRPIFDTADAAAIYSGGICAVDINDSWGCLQGSVLWSEDGSRGGAGGGVRAWYEGEKVVGWTTF